MKKPTSHTSQPLVSIITPLYNAARFIQACSASIKAQTYQNWEHIIVDDASTDGSLSLAQELASADSRIRVVTLSRNKGAAYARNKATELASGDYIAFLDADDLWHPEKLSKQITFMQKHNCAVSYTSYIQIDDEGNPLGKRINAMPSLTYSKQHKNNYIGNLTGVYNASLIGKISAPSIRKRQDWALWLEAIKRSSKEALGLQEDLAFYRIREGSMSANKVQLVKYNFKFYNQHLEYSWFKSAYWLGIFLMEYFFVRPKYIEIY